MNRLSLVQFRGDDMSRAVAAVIDSEPPRRLRGAASVYELAMLAAGSGMGMTGAVASSQPGEVVDLEAVIREKRLMPPIDHPDPAHLYATGTGLTHHGSAESRDAMHRETMEPAAQTDSMRMFQMGIQGGKPPQGEIGAQPEWFYKGNGKCIVGSGEPLISPAFAQDAGEEPEIAGVYLIDRDGAPLRLGFCLANEFSDHITEKKNYLWLAHSKLRPLALGPELLTGALPENVEGTVRIRRSGSVLWEKPFRSGEGNMSHSIANLEYHHFKYDVFRQPGDVHVHVFGTSTLSFNDGIRTEPGDTFEIKASPFRWPLRNELRQAKTMEFRIGAL